jgi:hypothetical protein
MNTYIIKELQNNQSEREGFTIQADHLTAAKSAATRLQMFKWTTVRIEDASGHQIAVKTAGKWQDWN